MTLLPSRPCPTKARPIGPYRPGAAMTPACSAAAEAGPITPAFQRWLDGNGVRCHGVKAAFLDEGWRGIVAVEDLRPGSLLVQIPEHALMSNRSACQSPVLSELQHKPNPFLGPIELLALHLLDEVAKGHKSFWHHYIRHLPRSYTTLAHFTPSDRLELQVASAIATAEPVGEADQHAAATAVLKTLGVPCALWSLKAWRWATATVTSRSMFVPFDRAGVLTPFADLFNHQSSSPGASMSSRDILELSTLDRPGQEGDDSSSFSSSTGCGSGQYNVEHKEYRVYTHVRRRKGEQVFLCYGAHDNLDLLEFYGFVDNNNPCDKAFLPMEALAAAGLLPPPAARHCWLNHSGAPSWELLQALHQHVSATLKDLGRRTKAWSQNSEEEDTESCAVLKKACEHTLRGLPTSLEDDEQFMQCSHFLGLSLCCRLAVMWRVLYKRYTLDLKCCASSKERRLADYHTFGWV